jgi:hypothetical protein
MKATSAATPKRKKFRLKLKNSSSEVGTTGKLTDEVEEQICKLLRSQMSFSDACAWVGINRVTIWEWRTKGKAKPESRYGHFAQAVEKALLVAKAVLIHDIAQSSDIRGKLFLLKNRYPSEFRDRIIQEVSGVASAPVPVQVNPFSVQIICESAVGPAPEWQIRNHPDSNGKEPSRAL